MKITASLLTIVTLAVGCANDEGQVIAPKAQASCVPVAPLELRFAPKVDTTKLSAEIMSQIHRQMDSLRSVHLKRIEHLPEAPNELFRRRADGSLQCLGCGRG